MLKLLPLLSFKIFVFRLWSKVLFQTLSQTLESCLDCRVLALDVKVLGGDSGQRWLRRIDHMLKWRA